MDLLKEINDLTFENRISIRNRKEKIIDCLLKKRININSIEFSKLIELIIFYIDSIEYINEIEFELIKDGIIDFLKILEEVNDSNIEILAKDAKIIFDKLNLFKPE